MVKMKLKPIVIPDNVKISVSGNKIIVEGPKGKVEKEIKGRKVKIEIENRNVNVESEHKEMINTVRAIIANMIKGVTEGYEKKLVVRYSHFPVKLSYKNGFLIIENFLGEKVPRKAKVPKNVNVKIGNNEIILESVDKEAIGQAYANIRAASKIKEKDIRVFQDGIYLAD